jgi:hypothetical protein
VYDTTEEYTAADVLAKLLTVDGAGSGLDADLLDGNSSAFYSPASVSGTAAAILASLLTVDGSGSGLDADLLDGKSTGTSGNTIPLLDGANTWSGAQTFAAATVFNEAGADIDQRMEGDTDANLFFLDASTDRIGIGTATPSVKLDVIGNTRIASGVDNYLFLDAAAGSEDAVVFRTAAANRWYVGKNTTAEGGSDAGSNFIIRGYNDAGTSLGDYLTIVRSSGNATLTGTLTLPNTGLIVGASTPFSDAAGVLTLQNVDALDATTEATVEAAIDTLANLTSIQGRTVTLADAGANAFLGWDDTAGAYENLTAAEALAIIMTVDGTGSGLDADLLDGKNTGTSGNTVPLLDGANTWSGAQTFNAAFVFNETGADIDLRMEGDTNANLFFLDASTDRIGIGTNGPICLFHVAAGSLTPATELGGLTVTGSTTAMRLALGVNNDSTMYSFINSVENGVSHRSLLLQTLGGNVKIGSSNALRNTTDGSGQLVLFDSTAPSGTLTNGVSFYSASGEARVMDAAGNSTLLSPHDPVTNEWIYHSFDTRTGKGLRIDMERMVRFLNDKYKLDFVHEFAA